MNRIIILTSALSKANWTIIYKFIKSIICNEDSKDSLILLNQIAKLRLTPVSSEDVNTLKGKEVSLDMIKSLSSDICFSIIYQKSDDSEDFTELVPFLFLQQEFKKKIALGIDISQINNEKNQLSYYFKCSNFFISVDEIKPEFGKRNIYFIREKVNKKGEVIKFSLSLAGKGKDQGTEYKGDSSRKFLPLLRITKNSFNPIFSLSSDSDKIDEIKVSDSKDRNNIRIIKDAIEKFKGDLSKLKDKKVLSELETIQDNTLFGKWLEYGYFFSCNEKLSDIDIPGVRLTLQTYKNCIFELVQNIIFHGGGEGLLFLAFDKIGNISDSYRKLIPNYNKYELNSRFMRIGVFDFSQDGIVDTFKEEHTSLIHFFDLKSWTTLGLTHLEMRYAARLGIKTFVKTIIEHKGYFSVESNETDNNRIIKKRINTIFNNNEIILSNEEVVENTTGTYYEIMLPVIATNTPKSEALPFQRKSFFDVDFKYIFHNQNNSDSIDIIKLNRDDIFSINSSDSKDLQKKRIEEVGGKIITQSTRHNNIALDLDNLNYDVNNIFKLLAYLQLNSNSFEKIILVNVTDLFKDHFCGLIKTILIDTDLDPLWNEESAIILLSDNLCVHIISGRNKSDLYALNLEIHKFYNFDTNFFDLNEEFVLNESSILRKFILRYEFLVRYPDNTVYFDKAIRAILKRNIISNKPGFLVNNQNTYIGSKIIVKDYYEADTMFLNGFFVDRFASLIEAEIEKTIDVKNYKRNKKELVLIGYKFYSEYLLKSIQQLINKKRQVDDLSIHVITANEDKEVLGEDGMTFDFDRRKDDRGKTVHKRILENPEIFQFITIVPIGSTLSTNDKIISFFKLWFIKEQEKYKQKNEDLRPLKSRKIDDFQFVYNHCVIVVRDILSSEPSTLEKKFKWKSVDTCKKSINTSYENARIVNYSFLIAGKEKNNWVKRLNDSLSFPPKWQEERYVNFTENSSLNSQNLMGFPEIEDKEKQNEQHEIELERLYEFKDDIYKGHFVILNSHHRYYIDTETFVKRRSKRFIDWLDHLNDNFLFKGEKLHVLVTPYAESESDFVNIVNERVFNGEALIIYLGVNNRRNNIIHKLSFLNELRDKVSFHFVDQVLLSGETYKKTKSYLLSITGELKKDDGNVNIFSSIITILNRLSCAKTRELKFEIKKLCSFANLYYPSTGYTDDVCELCELQKYYDKFKKRTVLENCHDVIYNNSKKIIKKNLKDLIFINGVDFQDKEAEILNYKSAKLSNNRDSNRNFIRLILTHELFYRISLIVQHNENESNFYIKSCDEIHKELDFIYSQLCEDKKLSPPNSYLPKLSINQKINVWFKNYINIDDSQKNYFDKKLFVDKIISFIKIISSPPLSHYIFMRKYAQQKLLTDLYQLMHKNDDEYFFDDLRYAKSILKSLSFLRSNSLVRNDVITGVWRVLEKVINNLGKEINNINNYHNIICIYLNDKNVEIEKKEKEREKSNLPNLFLEEKIKELKTYRDLANSMKNKLEVENKNISRKNAEIIEDFSKDFQFFIKNSLVEDDAKATFLGELLRRGKEMNRSDLNEENLTISKTSLFLRKSDAKNIEANKLFENTFSAGKNLQKEYTKFLVWLFYDNTTILRKALDNFIKELGKKIDIYNFFKVNDQLKGFKRVKSEVSQIEQSFTNIIIKEYYYSSFLPYLNNEDKINYVRKLIYVTYAHFKLKALQKNKNDIETDTRDLMEIFAAIMGADAAFFTMKKDGLLFPISLYCNEDSDKKWKYDEWFLDNHYYTSIILNKKQKRNRYNVFDFPLIPSYNIELSRYGENRDLNANSLGVYLIVNPNDSTNRKTSLYATITFLYYKNNKSVSSDSLFRINFQESGRLLLLLKNDINKYVLDYLVNDKVFDLWVQEHKSERKFNKTFKNNGHINDNFVIEKMAVFDDLPHDLLNKLSLVWYHLTNKVVGFLFVNTIKDSSNRLDLNNNPYIFCQDTEIGHIFSNSFKVLTYSLLDRKWNQGREEEKRHKIIFNIDDIIYSKCVEGMNKYIVQSFIIQHLNNCLDKHCKLSETKEICITVNDNHILINESKILSNIDLRESVKTGFKWKMKQIRRMNCQLYSSTTLTSLQGYINYLNNLNKTILYGFDCYFDSNNSFCLIITFKTNHYGKNYGKESIDL